MVFHVLHLLSLVSYTRTIDVHSFEWHIKLPLGSAGKRIVIGFAIVNDGFQRCSLEKVLL